MADEQKRHPKGLFLLFFTELWERFGFYTMQTIIVLYMTKALGYTDERTYLVYGAFSSMLYLTPVVGGYLADRVLGFRKCIIIGGFLFIVGYLLTALPQESFFFWGLSAIIVANGFFKPNVSSIVGELYAPEDPRRDGGFTIFYMGINIGALFPPLITGALVTAYGWHTGFLLAAIGMTVGIITFLIGKKRLGMVGEVPLSSTLRKNPAVKGWVYFLLGLGTLCTIFLVNLVFRIPKEADIILIVFSLFIFGAIIYFLLKEKPEQRRKMLACFILILISIAFWAIYNQMFTSIMLFADRNMTKEFLGFTIDAEFTQFYNAFFIVTLSPILSWLWIRLDQRHWNPSTPMKFSLGVLFLSFGFLFLGGATAFLSKNGFASPWVLTGSYLLQTIGELLLSPIGLAMITRLSPKHLVGMMMGVWFLTQSAAFAIGGMLSIIADVPKDTPPEVSIGIYSHAFSIFGLLTMVCAMIGLMLVPVLKRLIQPQTT